jgi:tetratricopeptide (TPR) repeat protein
MKSFFLLLALTFTAALGAHAQDAGGDTLDAANQAYTEGHYDQASRQFQDLIQAHGYSAALCFDLANAEAKAGRIGPAILNYERARYLDPSDRDIDHNLQLARQQAGLKPNSLRWWQVALRALTINQWLAIVDGWLGLIALAVISNFFVNRMPSGRNRAIAGKVVKTTLFVAIPLFLFTTYIALLAAPLRIEGVVMSKDAPLRLSPFDAAEQIGTLPEGELVTVEQKHDNYFRIESRDGHYGWMTRQSLEPVIAGSFEVSDEQ